MSKQWVGNIWSGCLTDGQQVVILNIYCIAKITEQFCKRERHIQPVIHSYMINNQRAKPIAFWFSVFHLDIPKMLHELDKWANFIIMLIIQFLNQGYITNRMGRNPFIEAPIWNKEGLVEAIWRNTRHHVNVKILIFKVDMYGSSGPFNFQIIDLRKT